MKRFLSLILCIMLVPMLCGCEDTDTVIQVSATQTESTSKGTEAISSETEGESASSEPESEIDENGEYTDKENVALYIHTYGKLPDNYITKNEAQERGWNSKENTMHEALPGFSIGGDHFGNYDKKLPIEQGRKYKECDIDYKKGGRNAKRIIFSNDGLIFYTEDHYNTFEQLY